MVDKSGATRGIGGKNQAELRFSSKCRLHAPDEFSAVLSSRRVLRGNIFSLHYRPAAGTAETRLGLIIAKKLAQRAVMRNLLKRIAREAFRQARPRLPAFDLVLRLARMPTGQAGLREREFRHLLRAEVDRLLAGLPR